MTSRHTVPLALLAGGLIVSAAVYWSAPTGPQSPGPGNPMAVTPVSSSDQVLGNPQARVFVVVYSDYECAWCKTFHQSMRRIMATHGPTGEVALVYRQFPLSEIHPNARKHAQAALCVASTSGNEAFWHFSDALFDLQPVDPARYGEIAARSGAHVPTFQQCYTDAATTVDATIAAHRENALQAGAVGTPYSLIIQDGHPPIVLDGAYTTSALSAVIDQALRR